jgi:hypothetical protein
VIPAAPGRVTFPIVAPGAKGIDPTEAIIQHVRATATIVVGVGRTVRDDDTIDADYSRRSVGGHP